LRYGVTVGSKGPLLSQEVITGMRDLGATDLRFQVPWSMIEPNKGTYSWAIWDDAVAKCNAAGIALMLSIKEAPSFWQDAQGLPQPQGMAQIAEAMASRYDGKHGHGSIVGIDCGNEDFNLSSTFYFSQLAACMKAVYPAVKAINPALIVIPGATLQRNTAHISAAITTLCNEAKGNFDALNCHTYFGIPDNGHLDPSDGSLANIPSFPQYIEAVQAAMHGAGVSVPIWVTEFGWTLSTNYNHPARIVVDQATQWKYEKYCYDQAIALGVAAMFVFTLGFANPPDGTSLVQSGGALTVAYNGLKAYIAGKPALDPPPNNGGGNGSGGPTPAQIAQAITALDAAEASIAEAKSLLGGS
jgi:hypothetical protein